MKVDLFEIYEPHAARWLKGEYGEYTKAQVSSLTYLLTGVFADGEMAGERMALRVTKRRGENRGAGTMTPEEQLREDMMTCAEYYWDSVNTSRDGSMAWFWDIMDTAITELVSTAKEYHREALIDRKRGG